MELPEEYLYSQYFNDDDSAIEPRWWQSFNDSTLNTLVESALQNNRSLIAAASAVEQARYYLRVARSEFMPSLSVDLTAEVIHEIETTEQEYTAAPTIEWELSLFGALRNTKRSAIASILEQEWSVRGVALSLTSEVATAYFTLLQYQRSLQIATRSYELRCTATALVDSLYRYGMSNGTELMQAKSLVYSANIEMQKYQRAVATTSLSLSTLLGETPQMPTYRCSQTALSSIRIPLDIPVGLPSSLLERRPDVMKSYYTMSKAAAEVGIARANRFPSIAITGQGGLYATSLKGLTSGNPLLWVGTAELTAPIFSWGALSRKEQIARSKYEATVAEYEESILVALCDVESALITIEKYGAQATATAALVLANTKIAQNTTALYTSGMGDYLSVIDAERELYASQISLIEIVAQQYINYVDLFKALGGGW